MRDHRHGKAGQNVPVILIHPEVLIVHLNALHIADTGPFAIFLRAIHDDRKVIVGIDRQPPFSGSDVLIASRRIFTGRIQPLRPFHHTPEKIPVAGMLVPHAKHAEAGAVAVKFKDAVQLALQKSLSGHLLLDGHPYRQFRLKDDALLVCCDEGRGVRTDGVVAHVVKTVALADFKNTPPALHVARRMPQQRKACAIMRSTQKQGAAVERELRAFLPHFPHTETRGADILTLHAFGLGTQGGGQLIERGVEFIPGPPVLIQRHSQLHQCLGSGDLEEVPSLAHNGGFTAQTRRHLQIALNRHSRSVGQLDQHPHSLLVQFRNRSDRGHINRIPRSQIHTANNAVPLDLDVVPVSMAVRRGATAVIDAQG